MQGASQASLHQLELQLQTMEAYWRNTTITHFALQLTILLALGWLFQRNNGNARERP